MPIEQPKPEDIHQPKVVEVQVEQVETIDAAVSEMPMANATAAEQGLPAGNETESFHDRFLAACELVERSPLGQKHKQWMPYGVISLKLATIGLVLLKFTGWVSISWWWVFSPLWLPLVLAFLIPFSLFGYAALRQRRN